MDRGTPTNSGRCLASHKTHLSASGNPAEQRFQLARIEASNKLVDSLDAGFELDKARLNLLRALGHMEDWLHELSGK